MADVKSMLDDPSDEVENDPLTRLKPVGVTKLNELVNGDVALPATPTPSLPKVPLGPVMTRV